MPEMRSRVHLFRQQNAIARTEQLTLLMVTKELREGRALN